MGNIFHFPPMQCHFAVSRQGDTLFYEDFRLDEFFSKFRNLQAEDVHNCLIVHTACPEDRVHKHGIVELDSNNKVAEGKS